MASIYDAYQPVLCSCCHSCQEGSTKEASKENRIEVRGVRYSQQHIQEEKQGAAENIHSAEEFEWGRE